MTVLGEPRVPKHRAMIDPALLLLNLLVSVAFWFGKMSPAKGAPWPGRFSTAAPRPASGIGARTACREIGKGPPFEACSAVPTEGPADGPNMHGATPFNTPTRHLDASSRKPR